MKVIFGEAKLIKKVMNTVSSIVENAMVTIDEDGLTLKAISPELCIVINLHINKDAFLEYDVKESEKLNINLDSFDKVLKRAKNTDKVIIIFEDNRQYILLGNSDRKFDIPMYDIEVKGENIKIPDIKYLATVEFEPKLLEDAIKDVFIGSEEITFEINKKGLYFKCDKYEGELIKDMAVNFECTTKCKSKFSIADLKDIMKINGISGTIKLSIGNNTPAKIEYYSPIFNVCFILAPHVL